MSIQKFSSKTVLEATRERIEFIFDNFENIHVSLSGGKDSTVLAHLALLEAKKRNRKIGLFFLDEEVVYQSSIDQINYLMDMFPENVNRLWLQIEFYLTNTASLKNGQLKAWEKGKSDIWMRKKSGKNICSKPWDLSVENKKQGTDGIGFYDALESFETGYSNTAFLVGLRAKESQSRWYTVTKNPAIINNKKIFWSTKKGENFSMYPIYDWEFHDIWKYIYDEKLKYSKIYDMQLKKGFNFNKMRISSLIHEKSFKSLCELPEFEPKTYQKLLKRIEGISFVQETGKDSKMFKVSKLPKNFTSWIDYRNFLIETYPNKDRLNIFTKRFSKHLNNEFVAKQQCRQLVLNDYENNLPIINKLDPREELIEYYREVL